MVEATESFWRGRRVIVTGHTGFKGAWLSAWLKRLGAEVTGYALEPPSQPSLFVETRLDRQIDSRIGDIRDLERFASVAAEVNPHAIFHLAAQALVRPSYEEPLETLTTNAIGTAHVLQVARECDELEAVLIVTSDKCYEGEPPSGGHDEDAPLGGYDPYSVSKACAELITSSWRRSFGDSLSAVASARAGNVIGGGDWGKDRLIPDAVRAIENDEPLVLRRPGAVRPWQHVLDALHGYLVLAERMIEEPGAYEEAFNFGPDSAQIVSVHEVVRDFYEVFGKGNIETSDADSPHETGTLLVDASKAHERLGWQPRLSYDQTIEWTAAWYRDWMNAPDQAWALVSDQLDAYESLK